jgi:thiazole tautomerase (transcriptional regulator TenI)
MKLMAVTDNTRPVNELAEKIIAIKDVIDFVQIREKSKTAREIVTLLDHLQSEGVHKEKIIINDRLDIALCMNIPNLHLPEHGLPIKIVRQLYPHLRVGCSVHSFLQGKAAESDGADYVMFGHCFTTNSKKGIPPRGIDPIIQMKKELSIPVYAIGGIKLNNIPSVQKAQADGIAVMSSIFAADEPYLITKKFYEEIHGEKTL